MASGRWRTPGCRPRWPRRRPSSSTPRTEPPGSGADLQSGRVRCRAGLLSKPIASGRRPLALTAPQLAPAPRRHRTRARASSPVRSPYVVTAARNPVRERLLSTA